MLSLTLASANLIADDDLGTANSPTFFPKGQNAVTTIYPVDISNIKFGEDLITLQALQGIIAKYSGDQLYLCTSQDKYSDYWYAPTDTDKKNGLVTADKFWLNYLTSIRNPKLTCTAYIDLPGVITQFKQYIKGYVTYSSNSLNLAVSYAGVNDYIPLTQTQIKGYGTFGLTNSASADSYTNATFYNAFKSSINQNLLFELNPAACSTSPLSYRNMPRDYAAMNKAMICFSSTATQDLSYYNTSPMAVIGWGSEQETSFVTEVSAKGDLVLPCDWGQNLSLLSSSTSAPMQANTTPMPQLTYDSSKKYVTFIISDGDNLQLWLNTANDNRWWGNSIRTSKTYPVGWTMPPAMYYLAPDAWNYYEQSAIKNGISNDEFICGPSGIGYNYGGVAGTSAFTPQLSYMNTFMQNANMPVLTIFGNNDWGNKNWLGSLVGQSSVQGGFYFGYPSWPPIGTGVQFFTNTTRGEEVPIMYANAFLKDDFTSPPNSSSVNDYINNTISTINSNSFTSVYVCKNFNGLWNNVPDQNKDKVGVYIMNDIDLVVTKLSKNNVVVVSPSQMISLLKQAHAKGKI